MPSNKDIELRWVVSKNSLYKTKCIIMLKLTSDYSQWSPV